MPTPFSRASLSFKNATAQSSKDESSPLAVVPSVGGDTTSSRPSHSEPQKLVRATSWLDTPLAPVQAPLGSGVDRRP
jgi:hypothetical protein